MELTVSERKVVSRSAKERFGGEVLRPQALPGRKGLRGSASPYGTRDGSKTQCSAKLPKHPEAEPLGLVPSQAEPGTEELAFTKNLANLERSFADERRISIQRLKA